MQEFEVIIKMKVDSIVPVSSDEMKEFIQNSLSYSEEGFFNGREIDFTLTEIKEALVKI